MNVTIAVDLKGEHVANAESLHKLRNHADIVFVTTKKRYELPEAQMAQMNAIGAKLQREAVAGADGVVFCVSSDENLDEHAVEYIKDYYRHNKPGSEMPAHVRDLFVSKAPPPIPATHALVSCIIPVYNAEKYLREAIDSVVNQTIGFEASVQLILVNDGSVDGSGDICAEYAERYPDNVVYIVQENQGVSAARNAGLDVAGGEFVAFLDADDKHHENFMDTCIKFLMEHEKIGFVSVPLQFFDNVKNWKEHPLHYKFADGTRVIDTNIDHDHLQGNVNASFFRKNTIGDVRFRSNAKYGEDSLFMSEILEKHVEYGVCDTTVFFYRKRFEEDSALDKSRSDPLFYHKLTPYINAFIDGSENKPLPKYIQSAFLYQMQSYRTQLRLFTDITQVDSNVRSRLMLDIIKILRCIDIDVIAKSRWYSYWEKIYLIQLGHGPTKLSFASPQRSAFTVNEIELCGATPKAWVTATSEKNNMLHITLYYTLPEYQSSEMFAAYSDGTKFEPVVSHCKWLDTWFLGESVVPAIVLDFHIPVKTNETLKFYMSDKFGNIVPARLFRCKNGQSNLSDLDHAFFVGENTIVTKRAKSHVFQILPLEPELLNDVVEQYLKNFKDKKFAQDLAIVRRYVKMHSVLSKKRIWLFMDRYDKGDDNAEYVYKYCHDIDDGIDKYYVISKECPDYERLAKWANLIDYGSPTHKLMYMCSEKLISSHRDLVQMFPFGTDDEMHDPERNEIYRCFLKRDLVSLNHGITKDDLSDWQNRFRKDIKLQVAASHEEYLDKLREDYGYDEKVVKLTGMPRFDNYYDDNQKVILFMPSWRRDIVAPLGQKNESFKDSEFCKGVNAFLSNKELIEAAKERGYRIIFRPHPRQYDQLEDFEMDEYVEIAPFDVPNYKLYAIGSLIITDYSGCVIDFSYLKKPVLYYQFMDYHLKKGYFDYERDGFGEVVDNLDDLTQVVTAYMDNGCEMQDIYKMRVDEFFAYTDNNNCKRVYEAILEME